MQCSVVRPRAFDGAQNDDVDNDVNDDVIILDVLDSVADWTSSGLRRRHVARGPHVGYRDNRGRPPSRLY